MKRLSIQLVGLLCIGLMAQSALSNEFEGQVSEFKSQSEAAGPAFQKVLGREARFVPIVLPISNPTIGAGLGGGVLYMHAKDADANPNEPSTMTGVFGMYTDTDSWAVGGFHSGSYKDDSIRVSVPIVHGDFSLKYYGVGENSPFRENPIDYDAKGNLFTPEISFELPFDNWFLGTTYQIINIKTEFGDTAGGEEVPGYTAEQKTAGFGLISFYDSRNSNLWPSKGNWLEFSALMNGQYAGGDYNYLKSMVKWAQYFEVLEPLTLIYRLDGQFVEGEAPFWDLARIRLRGFLSGQYLDDVAATAQAELRWKANGVKVGKADQELVTWNDPPNRLSRTDDRYSIDAFYETKAQHLVEWLKKNNPHHPDVIVWGAGRVTRKRVDILARYGLRIKQYIDIKNRQLNCGTPVTLPEEIPDPETCFVLSMVGKRGAREQIGAFLHQRGFTVGQDYLPAS